MVQLGFYGAAETVTGSKYLLEADDARVLVDCGLFQGLKKLRQKNWDKLPFSPATVQAVVLTHAHLDHVGYLPRLVKNGFRGPIYCTPATAELAELILLDSAENQERDAEYLNRKKISKHHPALPLYDQHDARNALKRLQTIPRGEWFAPSEPIWTQFHDAGHLLGSNMIQVEVRNQDPLLRLLFSGDVGRYDGPLYHDPTPPPACDYFICESTYGDRNHPPGNLLDNLEDVVRRAVERGGIMLVSSFAVGRAQQLIYLLQILIHSGRIEPMKIYLDSPMSVDATHIYKTFQEDHDISEGKLIGRERILDGPNVVLVRDHEESKALNELDGPAVIISSSGMMTGGRILHHLKRRLPDAKNTIVLGGFMAAGTRGRDLQNGAKFIRIHGRDVKVRAAVESISGLSGHADRSELLRWTQNMQPPKTTFMTHGEPDSAAALAETLRADRGWDVVIPHLNQTVELD